MLTTMLLEESGVPKTPELMRYLNSHTIMDVVVPSDCQIESILTQDQIKEVRKRADQEIEKIGDHIQAVIDDPGDVEPLEEMLMPVLTTLRVNFPFIGNKIKLTIMGLLPLFNPEVPDYYIDAVEAADLDRDDVLALIPAESPLRDKKLAEFSARFFFTLMLKPVPHPDYGLILQPEIATGPADDGYTSSLRYTTPSNARLQLEMELEAGGPEDPEEDPEDL